MQRVASETPTLVPAQLAETCSALADRIHAAFPGRGIDSHAQWFSEHAAIDDIERLCADLENKSLQAVLLLEQIHQRIR